MSIFFWRGRMRRAPQVEALMQQFKGVIEERGGKVTKVDIGALSR